MFSLIIPLYNKQDSIVETLHCVLNQSFRDFEVLIVDDGSSDGSTAKVKELMSLDSRIHLIQKPNGGVSSARNISIRQAKYDYVAFLDADDLWEPAYLEEQSKLIHDFPDASMWGCAWGVMTQHRKNPLERKVEKDFRGIIPDHWQRDLHLFWTGAVVVRKSVFEQIGYFDERIHYGEDMDMWYRIILNYPVAYNDNTLAWYCQDAENRAMDKEIPLDKHLPYYIEKYAVFRKDNKEFRRYFDRECLYRLYPYALKNRKDPDLQRILDQIDFSLQKASFRFRFWFPEIYNWYLKRKGFVSKVDFLLKTAKSQRRKVIAINIFIFSVLATWR